MEIGLDDVFGDYDGIGLSPTEDCEQLLKYFEARETDEQ